MLKIAIRSILEAYSLTSNRVLGCILGGALGDAWEDLGKDAPAPWFFDCAAHFSQVAGSKETTDVAGRFADFLCANETNQT